MSQLQMVHSKLFQSKAVPFFRIHAGMVSESKQNMHQSLITNWTNFVMPIELMFDQNIKHKHKHYLQSTCVNSV